MQRGGAAPWGCTLAIPRCRLVAHHGALTPFQDAKHVLVMLFVDVLRNHSGFLWCQEQFPFILQERFCFIILGRMMIWQHPAVVII